jgi:hypothetical protein
LDFPAAVTFGAATAGITTLNTTVSTNP